MKLLVLLFFTTASLVAAADPPATWQENWFEHTQLLTLHAVNPDMALYLDKDVDKSITWVSGYMTAVWVYTKSNYGQFGSDQHLYTILHTNKYSGGHPSTYFDSQKSYRNAIDCGLNGNDAWKYQTDLEYSILTHEVSHIVEFASHGVHNSPAFRIWGDSKWAEIYIYDVYLKLGAQPRAQRWRQEKLATSDTFPRANTFWFRDWFLPIYERYGGAGALNRFFLLLSQYFPKSNSASFNRPQYTRDLNFGEFVHFWSGAGRTNLKALATTAFGWSSQTDSEFTKARTDFPAITSLY